MPTNDAAAPNHVCPGMSIHAIDQPPGIRIPPIADIDAHQTVVTAALAAKSSAETPMNAFCEADTVTMVAGSSSTAVEVHHDAARTRRRGSPVLEPRSTPVILVVAAPPDAR